MWSHRIYPFHLSPWLLVLKAFLQYSNVDWNVHITLHSCCPVFGDDHKEDSVQAGKAAFEKIFQNQILRAGQFCEHKMWLGSRLSLVQPPLEIEISTWNSHGVNTKTKISMGQTSKLKFLWKRKQKSLLYGTLMRCMYWILLMRQYMLAHFWITTLMLCLFPGLCEP